LSDDIKQYWPTIVGAFALGAAGLIFWPSERASVQPTLANAPMAEQGNEPAKVDSLSTRTPSSKRPEREKAKGETVFRPIVYSEVVPGKKRRELKEGDADVQQAVRSIRIELYMNGGPSLDAAREYFEKNKLSHAVFDTSEQGPRTRAQRISGQRRLPVLVVDGEAQVGFSVAIVERRLSAAIEKRLLPQ